jgi:hypothetical protein
MRPAEPASRRDDGIRRKTALAETATKTVASSGKTTVINVKNADAIHGKVDARTSEKVAAKKALCVLLYAEAKRFFPIENV